MDLTPAQQAHYEGLFKALRLVREHRDALIVEELKSRLPVYEAAEAAAYARVQELYTALREPEMVAGDLDADIAALEASRASWAARGDSPVMADRVEAGI